MKIFQHPVTAAPTSLSFAKVIWPLVKEDAGELFLVLNFFHILKKFVFFLQQYFLFHSHLNSLTSYFHLLLQCCIFTFKLIVFTFTLWYLFHHFLPGPTMTQVYRANAMTSVRNMVTMRISTVVLVLVLHSSMTSVWNMVTVIKSTIVSFQYRVYTEGTNDVDCGSITK